MAKTIEVPVWHGGGYLVIRVEGVANDHVWAAGNSVRDSVKLALAEAYRDGVESGASFRPLSERYPRAVKVNNHTHWWKRNG